MTLISYSSFAQNIPSTGTGSEPCGDCTPNGWSNPNGTPDISNRYSAGGQATTGGGATWVTAPLPLPPSQTTSWLTIRDLGTFGDESVGTTMSNLISGKLYKLSLQTMTTVSNADGENNSHYAGTYMPEFQYKIGDADIQTISTITKDTWGITEIYFKASSASMDLVLYPMNDAAASLFGFIFVDEGVETLHIAVELDAIELLDTDKDGVNDVDDIDDDNDGILDIEETGGIALDIDTDNDGIPDYLDLDYNNSAIDADNDGVPNHLDLDSDNDGIPDNIEAQTTTGFLASNQDSFATYTTNSGLNSAYISANNNNNNGLIPLNTDSSIANSDSNADYLDTDSDGDSILDSNEANLNLSSNIGINGLDNSLESTDTYSDVTGNFDDTPFDNFPNTSNPYTAEVNFRNPDISSLEEIDTDFDGVPNDIDIDDDNDGILDIDENCAQYNAADSYEYVNATSDATTVVNANNSIGPANATTASFNDNGDNMVLNFE